MLENKEVYTLLKNSIIEEIKLPEFKQAHTRVYVKRDDLIHSEISGNKLRKLKYNLQAMKEKGKRGILTFGGAYSNHLLATASICNRDGCGSIGMVRGEELNPSSNSTLQRCTELGMKLQFVTRDIYKKKGEAEYLKPLQSAHPSLLIVPEGGANHEGVLGCAEIMRETANDFDSVFVAQGTTATSCGILLALPSKTTLHVVPVLKGFESLEAMSKITGATDNWDQLTKQIMVHANYHFGGYGRYTKELLQFIQMVYRQTKLPLDPVYTGKAFYALWKEIKQGNLNKKRILFVHTGGLQTVKDIEKNTGINLFSNHYSD